MKETFEVKKVYQETMQKGGEIAKLDVAYSCHNDQGVLVEFWIGNINTPRSLLEKVKVGSMLGYRAVLIRDNFGKITSQRLDWYLVK